jgi:predicted ATPase/DNA-binding SARP family transcriptional activator
MNAQRDAQRASAAAPERLEFRLLGPLEALAGGGAVPLGGPKQRALLAHLLLRAGEAVPADELVDALWPDDPPASARHAVHVYVSRLRRALGDPSRIEARSRAYRLRAQPDEVDLGRFRRLVAEARQALAEDYAGRATASLCDALDLWRGRAVADLDGEPGVRELVLELEEERLAAIELRVLAELETGRAAELVSELEELLAEHPARERFHADLMLALHRAGRRDHALDAYARARRVLLDELGLEPSPVLQELAAAIRRDDPALGREPRELRARRHLPAPPNQFIGRGREVDEIVELVAGSARLVTLVGPGGIGKTRLALAAAARLASQIDDGVWFVDLSSLSEAALVVPTLAQALGVETGTLEEHLGEKRLLLVVDNLEQVADAAPALSRLLRAAAGVALLLTSRSRLRLSAEQVYEVAPLGMHDAVRLLVARAQAAARDVDLATSGERDLADICAALDHLPLAIELAGARLRDLSLAELRAQLERRLGLLVGGPVDVPPRQQTVRATIEWSYDLLGPDERLLFARLAIFAGGWTGDAAREICEATEDGLRALRENGLISFDGERFGMLATIRELALEHLERDESAALAARHAGYYTALAERLQTEGKGAGPSRAMLDGIGREYENLRAALRACRDATGSPGLARLAAALADYWSVRGPYDEARSWLEMALDAPDQEPRVLALVARALGLMCRTQADHPQAEAALERAVDLARRADDRELEASCLGNLGGLAAYVGEPAKARELLLSSRELALELGNHVTLGGLANVLGVVELLEGRLAEAERWFEESLGISERIENREGVGLAQLNLGVAALRAGRIDDARTRFRDSLGIARDQQDAFQTANCLEGLAAAAARSGDLVRAGILLGAAEATIGEAGATLEPFFGALDEETRAAVNAGLAGEVVAHALATGRDSPGNAFVDA